MQRLLLVSVTVMTACSTHPPTAAPVVSSSLNLTSATQSHIAGTFTRGDLTIGFNCLKDANSASLDITNAAGAVLYHGASTPTGSEERFLGQLAINRVMTTENLSQISDVSSTDGDPSLRAAFASSPEALLIPWLSYEIGATRGLTGVDYPATFAIHMLGKRVAEINNIVLPVATPVAPPTTTNDYCGENGGHPDDSCFGLCGPGCSCWWWLCADCDYDNPGCWEHDRACHNCITCQDPNGSCSACNSGAAFFYGGGCRGD